MKSAARLFVPSLTGCLLVASLLSSCTGVHVPVTLPMTEETQLAAEEPSPETPSPEIGQPIRVQYGVASWYGRKFHGRPTASGEPYDMYESTAAHRYMPLGTYAVVTNLDNGQTTRVLINDRGPFIRGRIMDLSYEAARQISMVRRGTARVKVEFLATDTTAAPVAAPPVASVPPPAEAEQSPAPAFVLEPERHPYVVQAGAYRTAANAERTQQNLAAVYPHVWITGDAEIASPFHRVRLGPFQNRDEAQRVARAVQAQGYAAAIVAMVQ